MCVDDSWIGSRFYFRSIRPEGYCEGEGPPAVPAACLREWAEVKGAAGGAFPSFSTGEFNGHGRGALVIPGKALRMVQCCRRRC